MIVICAIWNILLDSIRHQFVFSCKFFTILFKIVKSIFLVRYDIILYNIIKNIICIPKRMYNYIQKDEEAQSCVLTLLYMAFPFIIPILIYKNFFFFEKKKLAIIVSTVLAAFSYVLFYISFSIPREDFLGIAFIIPGVNFAVCILIFVMIQPCFGGMKLLVECLTETFTQYYNKCKEKKNG